MQSLPAGLSVVVPVYQSQMSLPHLVGRLDNELPALAEHHEVILVNDGSSDSSWPVICQLAREYSYVRGIDLSRNFGQHNALLAGVRRARYATAVTMDDDLQHRPEEIHKLLDGLRDDVDLVYGVAVEEEHGLARSAASRITKMALASALGAEAARSVSAFRAFRTGLREASQENQDASVAIDVLLSWATTRIVAVPVDMDQRPFGRSNYTLRKLTAHALNMLTGYSTVALRAVTYLGLFMAAFGLAVLIFVLGRYALEGQAEPGFAFIASIVAIFSGAQLFALGILGEYLGRIHFRSMGRPTYVIRSQYEG